MLKNEAHVLIIPTSSSYSSFEDDKSAEKKPFLSRVSSYDDAIAATATASSTTSITTDSNNDQKKRRRRRPSDGSLSSSSSSSSSPRTIGENVEAAAAETAFVSRLCFNLLSYLGLGYRWIVRFLALGFYAMLIMPGVLQDYECFPAKFAYYYYKLDLYLPGNSEGLKPVLAFVTGGAWIIGYKAWGALLGLRLVERDIIVACIDYRNFPQATISDMVKDASEGISFLCNNISEYGGDPSRVFLMGQSAGAHIAGCALVKQAVKEYRGEATSWSVTQLKAYFGLSGGYNLGDLVDHFHNRGLYRSIFLRMMDGEQSLQCFSPELMVQDPSIRDAVLLLPPIILFHGTADYSIPVASSKNFADCLQRLGAQAELILYKDKTHTDLFIQDPLRGGTDELVKDVASFVHAGDEVALAKDAVAPPGKRLYCNADEENSLPMVAFSLMDYSAGKIFNRIKVGWNLEEDRWYCMHGFFKLRQNLSVCGYELVHHCIAGKMLVTVFGVPTQLFLQSFTKIDDAVSAFQNNLGSNGA
ncbi:hypothetical protein Scep_022357 [Stephania cephalantha]|uniref:protein-S-isoprenylcysteine alpha-carbonyl methylesterase n=1 Tax=Stephania cephalantha TaxID=152367 RepID=A0AAP0FAA4_9MAGN